MLNLRRALKDLLAGGAFVAFGLAFATGALAYDIGTPLRMGPGYVPLGLGMILVLLGLAIVVKGFLAGEGAEIGTIPWKATVLILGAIVFFAVTVRGLGLVPSLALTALIAGFAGPRPGVVLPVIIAVGLTILSVLIFVVALQLRLPLFGPWVGA